MKSLKDKTYIITGATSGIGLAVAKELVRHNANLIGIGRSAERNQNAEKALKEINSNVLICYFLTDLSIQAQVKQVAVQIKNQLKDWKIPYLDGLLNNAASLPFRQIITSEGFDMQWAVNYLSGFLMTHLLLDSMADAPFARIVCVSSNSHYKAKLRFKDIQILRGYNTFKAYKHTKLAQVVFISELNRQLKDNPNIKAFAADPGLVNTDIGNKGDSVLMDLVWNWRRKAGTAPENTTEGINFLLSDPSIQNSDQVYWKHGKPEPPNPQALDEQNNKRLWEMSIKMCGLE